MSAGTGTHPYNQNTVTWKCITCGLESPHYFGLHKAKVDTPWHSLRTCPGGSSVPAPLIYFVRERRWQFYVKLADNILAQESSYFPHTTESVGGWGLWQLVLPRPPSP